MILSFFIPFVLFFLSDSTPQLLVFPKSPVYYSRPGVPILIICKDAVISVDRSVCMFEKSHSMFNFKSKVSRDVFKFETDVSCL